MHQLSLDGYYESHYSGPWDFISKAHGSFIRNCQTLRGSHHYNYILPASWHGLYDGCIQ